MRYILHSITEIDLAMKGMETYLARYEVLVAGIHVYLKIEVSELSDVMKRDPRIVARKLQPSREDQDGICSPSPS